MSFLLLIIASTLRNEVFIKSGIQDVAWKTAIKWLFVAGMNIE